MKRWGWTPSGMCVSEREELQFVHYSDYARVIEALHTIHGYSSQTLIREIAEAALLSAGEEL